MGAVRACIMTLEQMLEELNDSDVTCGLRDLHSSIDCLEQVDQPQGFVANVNDAIETAEQLLRDLKALRTAVTP